jgi:3-mercaptopyruvate sulfurtransferase SseA
MSRRKKKSNPVPVILMALGGLLLVGALIALALQPRPGVAPTAQVADHEEETYPEIQRVTLEEAKTALDEGKAVFLDVRGPAAFEAGRIPGSLLIPVNEMETRWNELDPEDWIITYCT